MSWSNEKVVDFINAVHLRKELWDVEDSTFRNRVAKKDGWEAVGKEFDISGDEASKKFKNLRTYAQNEKKKEKSGSGASKKKPWFAFEAIQFVLSRDVPNAGFDSENTTAGSANSFDDDENAVDPMDPMDPSGTANDSRPSSRASSRKRKSITPLDDETLNAAKMVLADACMRRNQRTPCSAFGELVAQKLQNYDPRTRSIVEMKVMQILHEADMQMHHSPTLGSSISQLNSEEPNDEPQEQGTPPMRDSPLMTDAIAAAMRCTHEDIEF